MSREIKFRAWVEEEKWDYYVYDIQKRADMAEWFGQSTIHIEQYTGLKDKNGKEIYEGDILRWVDDYDENAYINFDEGCFWVNWAINSERINGDMVDDLEVIGNIHENPELLGGEE